MRQTRKAYKANFDSFVRAETVCVVHAVLTVQCSDVSGRARNCIAAVFQRHPPSERHALTAKAFAARRLDVSNTRRRRAQIWKCSNFSTLCQITEKNVRMRIETIPHIVLKVSSRSRLFSGRSSGHNFWRKSKIRRKN